MSKNPRRPKIGFFGVFGAGNLGNECTLEALLYNLRKFMPTAEVVGICTGPEETASRYHVSAVAIRESSLPPLSSRAMRIVRRIAIGIPIEISRWVKTVGRLRGVDMLVMTGTGMLGDFGISPFDLHYDILRWSVAAKLCGCKVLFLSVGAGPIRHPLSRRFVKAALALADYRSYRDTFSRKYLESIGFDTTGDNVYPDLAFSLPRAMIPVRRCRGGQGGVIGLGVMTYYSKRGTLEDDERLYNVYVEKVASFMSRLLDRKYTIRLLIGDVTYDRRVREDLRRLLEGRGVQYPGKIIDEPASSFEDVLSQLSTTDIVVASRFHNVLLGLMVTKLVVAVSYHEKVEALITEIGLGEFCQDIEHIDIEGLVGQITRLEEHSENIRSEIDQRIEEYRKALDEQYDRIFGGGIAKAAVPACAG